MRRILPMLAAVLIALCSCSAPQRQDLKIYVVSRAAVSGTMSDKEIVSAAKSAGRLAFDGDDIEGYNWQSHTVFIKEQSSPSVGIVTDESGGSAIFKTDDTYCFVMTLKNELVYFGGFSQGLKNTEIPLQPYITDAGRYSFTIEFDAKYAENGDCRGNKKLYGFLNKLGMLSSKK